MDKLIIASLILFTLTAGQGVADGTLSVGVPQVEESSYIFPVVLQSPSDGVAALNFRLEYDPAVFRPVSVSSGAASIAAGKVVTANMSQPGEYVVVMMGLNRSTLRAGEVALVEMQCISADATGSSQVAVAEPALATWEGEQLPVSGSSSNITLGAAQSGASSEITEKDRDTAKQEGEMVSASDVAAAVVKKAAANHFGPQGGTSAGFRDADKKRAGKKLNPEERLEIATRKVAALRSEIPTPAESSENLKLETTVTGRPYSQSEKKTASSGAEAGLTIARAMTPEEKIESERGHVSAAVAADTPPETAGVPEEKEARSRRYMLLGMLAGIPAAAGILLLLRRKLSDRGFPLQEDA